MENKQGKSKKAIISIILGVLAILLSKFGIIPIIIGIVGIILSKQSLKSSSLAKWGMILSIIGIILAIILFGYEFTKAFIPAYEHAKALATAKHK